MENPEKGEPQINAAKPTGKSSPFPLDLIDKQAGKPEASQKRQVKNTGLLLSVPAPNRVPFKGKKWPLAAENPWKAASSTSREPATNEKTAEYSGPVNTAKGNEMPGERPVSSPEDATSGVVTQEGYVTIPEPSTSGGVTLEEPAERAPERSLSEGAAPDASPDEEREIKPNREPMSIMEVFMAAKKRGRPPGKKSSAAKAMGDALNRQEKKSNAIEKMVDKNIAAETSRTKPEKRAKRPLADIVSEVASRKEEKQAAPRAAKAAPTPAAKAARPKPRPQVRPRRAPGGPVEVVVEDLASGIISVVGSAVGGVIGAGQAAGEAVSSGAKYVVGGTKSAAAKIKSAVTSKGAGEKQGEGPVAAAAKTATQVTEKVAGGLVSVASGAVKVSSQVVYAVAAVAGYTVKGGIGIVSDTANGVLNLVKGPKKKRSKPA